MPIAMPSVLLERHPSDRYDKYMSSLKLQDIGLPAAKLRAIERKAKGAGQTAAQFIRSLIERDLLADKSFDEILRPVRQDFQKSGVTPEELDRIVARARKATRPKSIHKHGNNASGDTSNGQKSNEHRRGDVR